jgi:hypothetical protein
MIVRSCDFPTQEVLVKRTLSLLTAFLAFSSVAVFAAGASKAEGWISDSMCGAKHMGTGAECVRSCIKHGMKPVFVDPAKHVWAIDNPDSVKDFYGDHVKIEATKDVAANSVHIEHISAVK